MTGPSPQAAPHPPASPKLDAKATQDLDQKIREASAALRGTSLAQREGISPDELQRRFAAVRALCDKGHFDQALPDACDLFLEDPYDWRHSFVIGMCLRELRRTAEATLYLLIAIELGAPPVAALRFGQCLRDLGHADEAAPAFSLAARLSANDPQQAALHAEASAAAHR